MMQRLDVHVNIGIASQRRGERGDFSGPIARVGDDDHIGIEFVLMLLDEGNEAWRSHFLFAFDEDLDIDLQIVAERLQCAGMNGDSAAIIGRAASVQAGVDYRADEWVGVPYAGIGHRLHVVMRVQQHGWSVDIDDFRTDDLPSARRAIGIVRLHHMRIDTYLVQLFGHELRGLFHMIRGNAFCGNGLQRDFLVQHVDNAVKIRFDARANLIGM